MADRFLVTGALGCLGSWVVRRLVAEGTPVVATDIGEARDRWRLLDAGLEREVELVRCDVADAEGLERVLVDRGVTHIVHLAALQVPFARAQPMLGARVNVEGMAAVLESARRHPEQLRGVAFASSIAVFGPPSLYGEGPVANAAPPAPSTLYGAYKQCDEWMSRVYQADHGVASIGLRPATVYGPARDQGVTSSPSRALLAAAAGRPFHVEWGGHSGYAFVDDVAAAFIAAARACADGAGSETYNLPAVPAAMEEVVDAIAGVVPEAAVDFEPTQLPFPFDFDASELRRRVGGLPETPLRDGVRRSIETFRAAIAEGRLDVDRVLGPAP
jgi:UDP-glucuronate 4-epimerase